MTKNWWPISKLTVLMLAVLCTPGCQGDDVSLGKDVTKLSAPCAKACAKMVQCWGAGNFDEQACMTNCGSLSGDNACVPVATCIAEESNSCNDITQRDACEKVEYHADCFGGCCAKQQQAQPTPPPASDDCTAGCAKMAQCWGAGNFDEQACVASCTTLGADNACAQTATCIADANNSCNDITQMAVCGEGGTYHADCIDACCQQSQAPAPTPTPADDCTKACAKIAQCWGNASFDEQACAASCKALSGDNACVPAAICVADDQNSCNDITQMAVCGADNGAYHADCFGSCCQQ